MDVVEKGVYKVGQWQIPWSEKRRKAVLVVDARGAEAERRR
jgi:hypothetical protein